MARIVPCGTPAVRVLNHAYFVLAVIFLMASRQAGSAFFSLHLPARRHNP
jgi:hypothetical protein